MSIEIILRDAIIGKNDSVLNGLLLRESIVNFGWRDELANSFLHLAVSVNNTTAISLLLEKSPSLTKAQNCAGNSPLHLAAMYDYPESAALIFQKDKTYLLNDDKRTPLDVAIYFRSTKVCKVLDPTNTAKKAQLPDARPSPNLFFSKFPPPPPPPATSYVSFLSYTAACSSASSTTVSSSSSSSSRSTSGVLSASSQSLTSQCPRSCTMEDLDEADVLFGDPDSAPSTPRV